MNPYLILSLVALPLFGACADDVDLLPSARADAEVSPAVVRTAQPGPDTEWVNAVLAAKISGSLYRIGSFFPYNPASAAVVLP